VEQKTLRLGMARLAQFKLNWHEVETDSEENSKLAGLNTCAAIIGWRKCCMSNICSMSNPTPISWQDVEDTSAKDEVTLALNKLITAGTPDEVTKELSGHMSWLT
jgi:hypothetical protein